MYWNFRPLLLRQPIPLPMYKSVILSSQKRKLAAAALLALDSATQFHALLVGCHTRLAGIVYSTFEAAVLLMLLYTDPMFEEDCPPQHLPPPGTLKADPLQATICRMTRPDCLHAAQGALKRLRMLVEVSSMADIAANTLTQLLGKAADARKGADTDTGTDETLANQNQEAENATTALSASAMAATAPQPGTTFPVPTELDSWLPNDLADLRHMNDIMSGSEGLATGDLASWPSFDASNLYSQQTP